MVKSCDAGGGAVLFRGSLPLPLSPGKGGLFFSFFFLFFFFFFPFLTDLGWNILVHLELSCFLREVQSLVLFPFSLLLDISCSFLLRDLSWRKNAELLCGTQTHLLWSWYYTFSGNIIFLVSYLIGWGLSCLDFNDHTHHGDDNDNHDNNEDNNNDDDNCGNYSSACYQLVGHGLRIVDGSCGGGTRGHGGHCCGSFSFIFVMDHCCTSKRSQCFGIHTYFVQFLAVEIFPSDDLWRIYNRAYIMRF
ncbi:hypothetical protein QBC42DRAFT_33740 [Cladorrhinum samala]|uniref:Uncharacterized protein n=1 Tax=Cladorrhinum samala TaxID=585594 RepID=A0AAV9HE98_9PEZI|nr:hypothetical protein QBC42DRAFT_33740 [Cladorrhinum samala]